MPTRAQELIVTPYTKVHKKSQLSPDSPQNHQRSNPTRKTSQFNHYSWLINIQSHNQGTRQWKIHVDLQDTNQPRRIGVRPVDSPTYIVYSEPDPMFRPKRGFCLDKSRDNMWGAEVRETVSLSSTPSSAPLHVASWFVQTGLPCLDKTVDLFPVYSWLPKHTGSCVHPISISLNEIRHKNGFSA